MTCHLRVESPAGLAGRYSFPWRLMLGGVMDLMRAYRDRARRRRELLDYMAADHRAAADLRFKHHDAHAWAERPFWRL